MISNLNIYTTDNKLVVLLWTTEPLFRVTPRFFSFLMLEFVIQGFLVMTIYHVSECYNSIYAKKITFKKTDKNVTLKLWWLFPAIAGRNKVILYQRAISSKIGKYRGSERNSQKVTDFKNEKIVTALTKKH